MLLLQYAVFASTFMLVLYALDMQVHLRCQEHLSPMYVLDIVKNELDSPAFDILLSYVRYAHTEVCMQQRAGLDLASKMRERLQI